MNELVPNNFFLWVLGGFVSLLAAIFEVYRRKVDVIEISHAKLGDVFLSKGDFQLYMQQMREDRQQMHKENLDRLKTINDGMERVHERIDQLFSGPTK